MGGSGTTNVTNTGLGDDQYQTLANNQKGIADSIDVNRSDAIGRFNQLDSTLGGINSNISSGVGGLRDYISSYGNSTLGGVNEVKYQVQDNARRFGTVQNTLNNVSGDVRSGFSDVSNRFDQADRTMSQGFATVQDNQQDIQSSVDIASRDQRNAMTDLSTGMSDGFNAADRQSDEGFASVSENLNDFQTNTQNQITAVQSNVLGGQQQLGSDLSQLRSTNDVYYGDLSSGQADIQSSQEEFRTNFDDYIQKYSDDVTLANQTRADLQTGLSNTARNLRNDVGLLAQATAENTGAVTGAVSDAFRSNVTAIDRLGSRVEGGFNQQQMSQQQNQENLVTRLSNVGSMVNTVGSTIDENTRQQYENLLTSFDSEGNLIRSSIDAQGNNISREFNDQGELIIQRFDQSGTLIGSVGLNVDRMLTDAEMYQGQLRQGQTTIQSAIGVGQRNTEGLFDSQNAMLTAQGQQFISSLDAQMGNMDDVTRTRFSQLRDSFDSSGNIVSQAVDALGNTVTRQIDQNGNLMINTLDRTGRLIEQNSLNLSDTLGGMLQGIGGETTSLMDTVDRGFSGLNQGLERVEGGISNVNRGIMAATQDNAGQFQRLSSEVTTGFNAVDGTLNERVRSLAQIAANQNELNEQQRRQFSLLSSSFDETGGLIRNSILDNGTTINRAIDTNGNLLLRAFDATGRAIGNEVFNINRSLMDLSQLDNYAGASVRMGNLSPAMREDTPTGGFLSPYTITR